MTKKELVRTVTKKELVRNVAEESGMSQSVASEVVQKTLDTILNSLARGERVELRNFGVFDVKVRSPRQGRNISTGDAVYVPEKLVVVFKPSKQMNTRVAKCGEDNRFEESGFIPNAKSDLEKPAPSDDNRS